MTKKRLWVTALFTFQYNMGARLDDASKEYTTGLMDNPIADQALIAPQAQMCWSKNIAEERDAPKQILLGAMNSKYCVLLKLGCYLEHWTGNCTNEFTEFLFGFDGLNDPKLIKRKALRLMKIVLQDDRFDETVEGSTRKKGTHSLRKLACYRASLMGMVGEFINIWF